MYTPEELEKLSVENMEYFRKKLDKLCEKTGISIIGVIEGTDHAAFYMNGSYCINDLKGTVHFLMDQAFDLIQEKTIEAVKRKEK